jgi:hypothetical protein
MDKWTEWMYMDEWIAGFVGGRMETTQEDFLTIIAKGEFLENGTLCSLVEIYLLLLGHTVPYPRR